MHSEKGYVIYFIQDKVKWYYTNCFFKPFMPGWTNAVMYSDRESAENAIGKFENDESLRIEEVWAWRRSIPDVTTYLR